MSRRFSVSARFRSVRFAVRGIITMLQTQHNAWLHAVATGLVGAAAFRLKLPASDWLWLIPAIVSVWTAEALNTAFEFLADAASPDFHPLVEKAKDVAAGAVLITACGAIAVGILVFGPHLTEVFAGP
ncbi:MAG: diacylglycerol kinase family protein [Planctomycetaceae bacterium]|nr:diacylglycerol kinase family protein [Planctomycetaceae bacterium]